MKALTIQQPWASAIIAGIKTVENRGWATHYTGPLAIHAGQTIDRYVLRIQGRPTEPLRLLQPLLPFEYLPYGAIIGIVDLKECVDFDYRMGTDPFAFGPVCWMLENPRPLTEPIPWRGKQGLWSLPDNIISIEGII